MPISEAKFGCELPVQAMRVRGQGPEHGTQEGQGLGAQGLGKEEAVMESRICTACGISVLDKGARLCVPSHLPGTLVRSSSKGITAGAGSSLSSTWCRRVCLTKN